MLLLRLLIIEKYFQIGGDRMKYLMLHDIREISLDFFPKRYTFPYFYTIKGFEELLIKFRAKSYDVKDNLKYIYTFDDGLIDHLHIAKLLYEKK